MRSYKGKAVSLDHAPVIQESPVNIECKVRNVQELGSHHMFLAEVTAVQAEEDYMDENGRFDLNRTGLWLILMENISVWGKSWGHLDTA